MYKFCNSFTYLVFTTETPKDNIYSKSNEMLILTAAEIEEFLNLATVTKFRNTDRHTVRFNSSIRNTSCKVTHIVELTHGSQYMLYSLSREDENFKEHLKNLVKV